MSDEDACDVRVPPCDSAGLLCPPYAICPCLSPEAAVGLRSAAHSLHPLPNDLVHLEELCATSVDTDRLSLEQVSLRIPVRRGVRLDALGVAGGDESVAVGWKRGTERIGSEGCTPIQGAIGVADRRRDQLETRRSAWTSSQDVGDHVELGNGHLDLGRVDRVGVLL